MEFLIDLLTQLSTRRFLRPLVADLAVVSKCHLSALYTHEKGCLFSQLVDPLQFYEDFEIDGHFGTQLSDDDVMLTHYSRLQAFQLLTFKQVPNPRRDFLTEVRISFFKKRQSQKEAINALPLYPNEQIMWDESLVLSINHSGEGCLALPKLNLQFLTLHDYLLRNFNLFRLECTYEIREDIQEVVLHLLAYVNNEGETSFRGLSRTAVPFKGFRIKEAKQPNIGEVKPASVTPEIEFTVSSYRAQVWSEWDSLKEHDMLFLLSIRPSFEPLSDDVADKSTVPQRLGLQFVRGCEVIEIRDDEGNLMNDFTGRVKREEWKPPKG